MTILCLIPIGYLIRRGYFIPQTMRRLTGGEIDPYYALCKN
jgi:hypothetical protein